MLPFYYFARLQCMHCKNHSWQRFLILGISIKPSSFYLEPCPFCSIDLVVKHGLQDFFVTIWYQADSP